MAVSSIVGEFKNLTGTVEFDGRNLRQANVQAKLDTQSLNTHSLERDQRWRGKSFFDVAQYPCISFKSQKIVPDQFGNFRIQGILAIHGYAREISLDAQAPKSFVSDSEGVKCLGVSATTFLDLRDFNISGGPLERSRAFVGDKFLITLTVQLKRSNDSTQSNQYLRRSGGEIKQMQVTKVAESPPVSKGFGG